MAVTAVYAAVLALLFVVLSVRVIKARRGAGAALGDGGDPMLLRRMRVQGNFSEYVPLGLILLGLAEGLHVPVWWLHGLGGMLLAGRVSHAVGVSRAPEVYGYRVVGMALTFTMMIAAAATCLVAGVLHQG